MQTIYDSLIVEAFEVHWARMVSDLRRDGEVRVEQFGGLYEERKNQVPVYVKRYFALEECPHLGEVRACLFFDKYIHSKTT